jgi:hypothetical protein
MTTRYQRLDNGSAGGMVKSQFMNIRLAPKEFVRIDHPLQPCRSGPNGPDGGGPDCEIECFQRAVTSVTNCRFSSIILFFGKTFGIQIFGGMVVRVVFQRLPYMNLTSAGIPYCNSSASVKQTEELVARLITETRSQLKCNCIESCSKV